jgi:hypothetical protein
MFQERSEETASPSSVRVGSHTLFLADILHALPSNEGGKVKHLMFSDFSLRRIPSIRPRYNEANGVASLCFGILGDSPKCKLFDEPP